MRRRLGAGLHPLQARDRTDMQTLMLRNQIDHLAADHAGSAGSAGKRGDELATHGGISVRIGIGKHLEGGSQQPIAGEHGGRLVKLLVAGRAPTAQITIVHRW